MAARMYISHDSISSRGMMISMAFDCQRGSQVSERERQVSRRGRQVSERGLPVSGNRPTTNVGELTKPRPSQERRGNNLKDFKDFYLRDNAMALTVSCVLYSLDIRWFNSSRLTSSLFYPSGAFPPRNMII